MSNGRKTAGIALGFLAAQTALAQTQPLPMDASARSAMAAFKDFAKYPPDSRPLTTSNWDLLHPWSVDTSSLPMIPQQVMTQVQSLRASGMSEEEAWGRVNLSTSVPRYQFELSKAVLAGMRDELVATLTVTPADSAAGLQSNGQALQVHITKAELIGDDAFGSPSLGSVPFSCRDGGSVCTFRWKAPAARTEYWGVLTLVVTANVAGLADEFVLRQSFYSSPLTAGRFTGQFQERLENGSLVVDAGVDVQRRMACFVSANLYSTDKGVPTHHAERRLIVDPGMKTVSFTFFGKIFRDYGHEGAFRVRDLKGVCENLSYPPEWFMDSGAHQAELQAMQSQTPTTREPPRIYFEYNDFTYNTKRYASTAFSNTEWQSPDSARKLQMYQQAVGELDNPSMEAVKQQMRKTQAQPR